MKGFRIPKMSISKLIVLGLCLFLFVINVYSQEYFGQDRSPYVPYYNLDLLADEALIDASNIALTYGSYKIERERQRKAEEARLSLLPKDVAEAILRKKKLKDAIRDDTTKGRPTMKIALGPAAGHSADPGQTADATTPNLSAMLGGSGVSNLPARQSDLSKGDVSESALEVSLAGKEASGATDDGGAAEDSISPSAASAQSLDNRVISEGVKSQIRTTAGQSETPAVDTGGEDSSPSGGVLAFELPSWSDKTLGKITVISSLSGSNVTSSEKDNDDGTLTVAYEKKSTGETETLDVIYTGRKAILKSDGERIESITDDGSEATDSKYDQTEIIKSHYTRKHNTGLIELSKRRASVIGDRLVRSEATQMLENFIHYVSIMQLAQMPGEQAFYINVDEVVYEKGDGYITETITQTVNDELFSKTVKENTENHASLEKVRYYEMYTITIYEEADYLPDGTMDMRTGEITWVGEEGYEPPIYDMVEYGIAYAEDGSIDGHYSVDPEGEVMMEGEVGGLGYPGEETPPEEGEGEHAPLEEGEGGQTPPAEGEEPPMEEQQI